MTMKAIYALLSAQLILLARAFEVPKSSSVKCNQHHRRTFLSNIIAGSGAATLTTLNPKPASAADDMTVPNYIRQVFGSPLVGATPGTPAKPTSTFDTREARNRAYDEAFEQDARDRDAYYGQMAMRKRQETAQNVQQYRESLGLDGKGDVRMRVGEERVQGLASLRELKAEYLSSQMQGEESSQEGFDKTSE